MSTQNIKGIAAVFVICGLLIGGLAYWLGPKDQAVTDTPDTNLLTGDRETNVIPGPLSPEALIAYEVTMTNDNNPVATVVTNVGTFTLELFTDTMPVTAGNFIKLAKEGFYDGVKFHRVIPDFMIQGGDPITKTNEVMRYGTGGPGYSIPDEHVVGKYLSNIRGTIAMANSGPNSGGSQFFINVANNINLDFDKPPLSSKHPVFGQVLSGMEVVDKISLVERNPADMPLEPVIIESITIAD